MRILLIISGSIAAVKAPELIRKLRTKKIAVRCIVTKGGAEFVDVKEIETLSGHPVSMDLFSPKEKKDMWHIRFSRETDMMVVAPASADLIAKMAHGIADDMASATLLANNKKLLVAPAMNTQMWIHPATQRNVKQIIEDGAEIIEPGVGMLACGEVGAGRMAEPEAIVLSIFSLWERSGVSQGEGALTQPSPKGRGFKGKRVLVTSGPTREAIDPVRYISNHSSGKQGHAIARALAEMGASVTLVTGPVALPDPANVTTIHVTSAREMLAACEKALPVDVAVCVAAVADWRVEAPAKHKLKKSKNAKTPQLALAENPDILKIVSHHKKRPKLVIGFAAETQNLLRNAKIKLEAKGCDWIVANKVGPKAGFDLEHNDVVLVTAGKKERWARMSKMDIARRLAEKIERTL